TGQMVVMLLMSFSKPVLIANVIAWPLAYMAASAYLTVFISPIALTLAPFVACLTVTLLIAWIAVAGQTVRAARMEPAQVLRHE
ncbi:MAG TPA: transporter, partial [Gammaproteobacteria bacterium]|nr:transporter [Gammaproteobacteria bacterium]